MDTTATATDAPQAAAPAPAARRRMRSFLRWLGPRRLAAVFGLAAIGFAVGYLGTWPPLATVMSGSMAPTIDTGDVVVLKRLDRAPRRGDVIALSVPDEARSRFGYPPKVVHRIVGIGGDGRITTKGDARERPDPFTVPSSAVRSHVVLTLPAAGRIFAFLVSPLGLIWLAGGVVLLFALPLIERQRDARGAEQERLDGLREELRRVHEELALIRERATVPHAQPELPEPQVALPEPEAEPALPRPRPEPATVGVQVSDLPRVDWSDLAHDHPLPQKVRRRSGGLVGAVSRRLR